MSRSHAQALHQHVSTFVDALAQAGVRHAVVAPGSRSAPLALTLAAQSAIKIWMHYDERSAAFFALGMAKALRFPVALICTSGTAAANFYPAVIEARYARVPLLVITADRPPELRTDTGAPQTIDQLHLYGPHAKWFVDMPLPEATPDVLRHARATAHRAVRATLAAPLGVVHINWPFREPLIPETAAGSRQQADNSNQQSAISNQHFSSLQSPLANDQLPTTSLGLLICGPQSDPVFPSAVAALSRALGWPILADPLSQVRCGPHCGPHCGPPGVDNVIDAYDAFLRDPKLVETLIPDVVVRFGDWPTSKPLGQYLQHHRAAHHLLVTGDHTQPDPFQLATEIVAVDPAAFCAALARNAPAPKESAWQRRWQTLNATARAAIQSLISTPQFSHFEGRVFTELADLLPDHATLWASSSMPVRDLDTFFPAQNRPRRFLANRGANGIDGVVSSALGAAAVGAAPLVLVIGDLAFYHDLNGLLAAKLHRLRATIVVINNDGGGIFSFLPQAQHPQQFEQLFGAPHGLDFQHAAALYGLAYRPVADWDSFRAAVQASFVAEGTTIIELRTDRQQNVPLHRAVWKAVVEAVTAN
jgi:2-succinyl-5-enolpyruvyl-6-hydroxy-3-cyclohexene-1-carboxylate synthase